MTDVTAIDLSEDLPVLHFLMQVCVWAKKLRGALGCCMAPQFATNCATCGRQAEVARNSDFQFQSKTYS